MVAGILPAIILFRFEAHRWLSNTGCQCRRLIRALAVETRENWLEAMRWPNIAHLAEPQQRTGLSRLTLGLSIGPTSGRPNTSDQHLSAEDSGHY